MRKKGIRSWLSLMMSVLLALLSVAPAIAAEPPLSQDPDIALLQSYGIVIGDGSGDLKLETTITRAELATIAVRAMGAEELSTYFEDSTLYSDMIGRFAWANRYAAMANSLGVMQGRGNGIFDPGADITNAEVFTVILRLVEREPQGAWNPELVMSVASQLGIAEGPTDLLANLPAYRGAIFKALAKAMTTIQLADGNTALRKYIDHTPPVLTVDPMPTTASATVTVTGTANGATSVTVNGQAATFNGSRYTASVSLNNGANAVELIAKDAAGNTATQSITITRSSNAAKIEVTGAASVKPGDTTTIRATAFDSANRALPADAVSAKLSNSLATYDAATGAFKAGNTAGKVTITFTSGSVTKAFDVIIAGLSADAEGVRIRTINTGNTLTTRKATTVKVEVVDVDDDAITNDNGRSVTLVAQGSADVTVSPATALTVAGVATFTVTGDETGDASLLASSSGLTSDEIDIYIGTGTRIVLTADPARVNADGYSDVTIRATLQNEDGNAVTNSSNTDIDITIDIDGTKDSTLTETELTIPKGRSTSSGYDGELIAGRESETVRISGEVDSSHNYTVVSTTVSVVTGSTGAVKKFEIVGATGTYDPSDDARLTVRAVDADGDLITSGSYAFQIEVTTSNNEQLVNGLPEGVDLTISGETPVKDADDAVIARTEYGIADLTLSYNKSGKVMLKVVGVDPDDEEAIDDNGDWDDATSGRGMTSDERDVRYSGTVARLAVKADLTTARLDDQPIGVLNANGSQTAKLKVYAVDANGGWVTGFNSYIELDAAGDDVTRLTTNGRVKASGGVAEFTVKSVKDEVGVDTWTATSGTLPAGSIEIATYDAKPDTPTVLSMHGSLSENGRVAAGDDYLVINIDDQAGSYGFVKVYRGSSLIYTSNVMNLGASPVVRVPKSKLSTTTSNYSIKVNNGFSDSESSPSHEVVNENPVKVNISRVRFDAAVGDEVQDTLIVSASGVASSGEIRPEALFLRVAGQNDSSTSLADLGASCTAASSSFTCKWDTGELSPQDFNGSVLLDTADGFYANDAAGKAAEQDEDTSDNVVKPMALITGATVDFDYNTDGDVTKGDLILTGTGLNHGTISVALLKIGTVAVKSTSSTNRPGSSTKATIPLTAAFAQELAAMAGSVSLTAEAGWLKNSNDANLGMTVNVVRVEDPLTAHSFTYDAEAKEVTLHLRGHGLTADSFDTSHMMISDRNGAFELDLTSAVVTPAENEIQISIADPSSVLRNKKSTTLFLVGSVDGTASWFTTEGGWPAEEVEAGANRVTWEN